MADIINLATQRPNAHVSPTALDWFQFILRAWVCVAVVTLFWVVNAHVLNLVDAFAKANVQEMAAKQIGAGDRAISAHVIMSLIAGTVAQIAIILLGITRDLFPATA
jgi:hypothetical protein